jgi:modulator of FtsH protease HflK
MRRRGVPTEIVQLARPLARLVDGAWQRMHWWIATMVVCYAVSGTTIVKPDEVAIVLRWGRLVGSTPATEEHGSGLLFAFPRPVDEVVRVPVKRVFEVPIRALAPVKGADDDDPTDPEADNTLDSLFDGYAVTGDRNIVQVDMVARYRIRDAAEWAFYGPSDRDVLEAEIVAAVSRSIGEMGVDRVLSDGRKDLTAISARRAQEGLDAVRSGLELASLELEDLRPPFALSSNFTAVQSAYIAAETHRKEAQTYAETTVLRAHAESDAGVQAARGVVEADHARAEGDASAFLALNREYRTDPSVVRERLYRDAVEQAIGAAGHVQWVPPPAGGRYNGFRIEIPSSGGTPAQPTPVEPKPEPPPSGQPAPGQSPSTNGDGTS